MSRAPGRSSTGARSRHCSWPVWPASPCSPWAGSSASTTTPRCSWPSWPRRASPSSSTSRPTCECSTGRSRSCCSSLGAALGGPALGLALLVRGRRHLSGVPRRPRGRLRRSPRSAGLALTIQRSRHARGDTRRALRVGLPTIPHQVALYLAGGALVLVAGHLYGTAEAGRLQLAVLIGSAPGVVTASLNNAWAPDRLPHRARCTAARCSSTPAGTSPRSPPWPAGFVAFMAPAAAADRRARAPTTPPSSPPRWASSPSAPCFSVLYLANVHLVFASGRSSGLAVVTPVALLVGVGAAWLAGGRDQSHRHLGGDDRHLRRHGGRRRGSRPPGEPDPVARVASRGAVGRGHPPVRPGRRRTVRGSVAGGALGGRRSPRRSLPTRAQAGRSPAECRAGPFRPSAGPPRWARGACPPG